MDLANKKPLIAGIGVVGIAALAWLAFGFLGIQAAFIDNEVDESADNLFDTVESVEEVEEVQSLAAEPSSDATTETPDDSSPDAPPPVAEALVAEDEPEPAAGEPEAEAVPEEPVVEPAPAEVAETTEEPIEEPIAEESASEPATEEPPAEPPAEPEAEPVAEEPATEEPAEESATPGEIVTISSGSFVGTNDYSVTGDALVLNNGTEQRFLRFENFVSDNGPDLKVYLRAANGEFISLGDLSGNIGDQNYEIPADVDLSVFNSVEIWCERFNSGFGFATLS